MKKKKYNRIGSLLMSLVLLVFFIPTASAATVSEDENTISINDLSADTISMLQELGVDLNSDSKIQLAPLGENIQSRSTSEKTLSVTNYNGDTAITSTILVFGEDGIVPINEGNNSARAQIPFSYYPAGKVFISTTATYNRYVKDGLYYYAQPLGVSFRYSKLDVNATVQNITVDYSCGGALFVYPGYEPYIYPDVHHIIINQNSPYENSTYTKNDPYSSSLVFWLNGEGAAMPGHYIYSEVTVDGTKYTGSSGVYDR